MVSRHRPITKGFMVCALVLLYGCTQAKSPPSVASAATPRPSVQVETPQREPLPELILTEKEERSPEKVYTFTLRDADIHEVMLAISKQTSINIVVDPDVEGRLTLDLRDITLKDALDTITNLLNLTYKAKQNLIRVSRPSLETRIFSLHYVNLKRSGASSAARGSATSAPA